MAGTRYAEPDWCRWELAADPRMVWIPMVDGQLCGVCAHTWDLDGPDAHFFLSIRTERGLGRLEVASFPQGLLADDTTLRASLASLELDGDNPSRSVLVSPPGTKVVVAQHPQMAAWPTVTGLPFHVLDEGWHRQGPHVCFGWLIQGWPEGSVPVYVEYLRFPVSLLPEDRRDSMARHW